MIEKNAKVLAVHMHQTAFIPGLKTQVNTKTLDARSCPGIQMTLGSIGVECLYNGNSFILPYVNFQCISMAPEEKPVDKKAK